MRKLNLIILAVTFSTNCLAQLSNGRVNSLVAAENYFATIAMEKGIRESFLKVSDGETIVFRPDPVRATDFYSSRSEDPGKLSWEPVVARISRSGDWGFTTGPYVYTDAKEGTESYGQYLSVWKMNRKGVWKLALDLGTPHPKPIEKPTLNFRDPVDFKFFRQLSNARLKQRQEIVLTTDKLFSTTLRKSTLLAYETFLGNDSRLLFPGYEPISGKENIARFLTRNDIRIECTPAQADRALGSDLAYSYGSADITTKGKTSAYNYVRIWESQEGKWNIITEIFSPRG